MPTNSDENKYDSRSHFPKGYLKCNLSVLAKGDRQQVSCKFFFQTSTKRASR